jgi:hypothetical protein
MPLSSERPIQHLRRRYWTVADPQYPLDLALNSAATTRMTAASEQIPMLHGFSFNYAGSPRGRHY